jgi:chemotaxis protein methyltransferase CheR
MTVTAETFHYVASLVHQRSAILLEPGKEYLVESRLLPLAREAGVAGVDDFVRSVRRNLHPRELDLVVEALTTNETSWFRDAAPFTALTAAIVPALAESRGTLVRLRIWSAACSTGQEPYSIAMTLAEDARVRGARIEIVATDLSDQVLARAREGKYTQLEVNRGLPAAMLVRHFSRDGAYWRISDDLRSKVSFHRHNLLDATPGGAQFDMVYLRNVLIYFDQPTKQTILRRVQRSLAPDGFLVLGAAETTMGLDDSWERVALGRGSVYRPRQGRS